MELDLVTDLSWLATMPPWLRAALDPERIVAALTAAVPGVAFKGAKVKRLLLDARVRRWVGTYQVATARGTTALRGTLTPPHLAGREAAAGQAAGARFGQSGWRCHLPELGLDLEPQPPETVLAAYDGLTDPGQAAAVLARALDRPVASCAVETLVYKPGSRAVLRYRPAYPPGTDGPPVVIAKTYRTRKGANAYEAMLALWRTPLPRDGRVALAEPLAWVPELKLLLQGTVPGERTLEGVLATTLAAGGEGVPDEVGRLLAAAARGLAAVHGSGSDHPRTASLDDRLGDARELLDLLVEAVPAPELAAGVGPLLSRLEALAQAHPAAPAVLSHGTFDPEQVLLDGERVGIIDFDDACLAEPAMDVGLFMAAIPDLAYEAGGPAGAPARLDRAAAMAEAFLAAYEQAGGTVSRARVSLWQAADHLVHALQTWTKAKPAGPAKDLRILDHHLRHLRV